MFLPHPITFCDHNLRDVRDWVVSNESICKVDLRDDDLIVETKSYVCIHCNHGELSDTDVSIW